MNIFSDYKRCQKIHTLIQRGSAKSPKQLAKHLSISVSYTYYYLKALKDCGAPLAYCRKRKRYYYTNPDFKWEELKF